MSDPETQQDWKKYWATVLSSHWQPVFLLPFPRNKHLPPWTKHRSSAMSSAFMLPAATISVIDTLWQAACPRSPLPHLRQVREQVPLVKNEVVSVCQKTRAGKLGRVNSPGCYLQGEETRDTLQDPTSKSCPYSHRSLTTSQLLLHQARHICTASSVLSSPTVISCPR